MTLSKGKFLDRLVVLAIEVVLMVAATRTGVAAPTNQPDTPAMIQWKALIPSIEEILNHTDFKCPIERRHIDILDASDFRGGGTSAALVDHCPGGAYTDWIVVMRLEGGLPVLARFRDAKGKVIEREFAQGASVMHAIDVKLMPDDGAIYDETSDNDGTGRIVQCSVNAYVWKATTKTFDWDAQLTKKATQEYCSSLKKQR
jgi:hypothetical protein